MHDAFPVPVNRRTFIKTSTSLLLASLIPTTSFSATRQNDHDHFALSFFNLHTREALRACYRSNGELVPNALRRINHILRDHRTDEIKPIDVKLLDLLHALVGRIGPYAPIHIISGYRSPRTNAALRKITTGVAPNSLHMQGKAIDIRIPGYRTNALRRLAIDCRAGGVGYYPGSDFVHLDTGRIKIW